MRWLRHPAVTFVAIRVGFLLGTALTLVWVQKAGDPPLAYGAYNGLTDYIFGAFAQWDSDWYLQIADQGYSASNAAFFPLYPALVYLLGAVTGSYLVAAVLLSLAGGAVAAWAMVEIARPLLGDAIAKDSGLVLALYPTAFVFTSAYSEGVFLAFATTSFLAAQRGRPWLAGALGAFAVGTRLMGLALVPALVALLWPKTRLEIPRLAPVILLPLMGLAAVTFTYDVALDDALAFSHAQEFWKRDASWLGPLGGVWNSLVALTDSFDALTSLPRRVGEGSTGFFADAERWGNQLAVWNTVDLLTLAGAIALTVVAYRRLGLAFALYSATLLAIATSAPAEEIPLQSMVRFVMTDFPVLIAGAALLAGRPALRTGVLVTLGALSAVAGAAFARKLWIA